MKKAEQYITGKNVITALRQLKSQRPLELPESRLSEWIAGKRFVIRETPIELIRRIDRELDNYFLHPLTGMHPRGVPPHLQVTRPRDFIVIDSKICWPDGGDPCVLDGYNSIAQALLAGKDTIRAYINRDCYVPEIIDQYGLNMAQAVQQPTSLEEHYHPALFNFNHIDEKKLFSVMDYRVEQHGKYRRGPLAISLLRELDGALDYWLKGNHQSHWPPLYAGYTPVIIGTEPSAGKNETIFLADGYCRVASALHQGRRYIMAYMPEKSQLLSQLHRPKKGMKH
jgi:hypothetical protein